MRLVLGRALVLLVVVVTLGVNSSRGDISLRRFSSNPLLTLDSIEPFRRGHESSRGGSALNHTINFPSIIAVPKWFYPRLGNYYMYFSDHHGLFIRLAYADQVTGPWQVYSSPALTIAQVYAANNLTYNASQLSYKVECSSPDVHVDHQTRSVRMYFKHRLPNHDYAILDSLAQSRDGISFAPRAGVMASYARVFQWAGEPGHVYMIDRQGNMLRSPDGYEGWEMGNSVVGLAFANQSMVNGDRYTGLVRHVGLLVTGHRLYVFGSRVGDAPEHILWTSLDLRCTLTDWQACATDGPAREAFRGVMPYEGADYPAVPSRKGDAIHVNQLRDPFPFADGGKCYMFYTIAGESGIAGGRIDDSFCYSDRARRQH